MAGAGGGPVKHIRSAPKGTSLVADATPWAWQSEAACAGLPLELFYGVDGETDTEADLREERAKKVCDQCPLNTWKTCLEKALIPTEGKQHGVQAGYTAKERVIIRRRRQRAAKTAGKRAA
ncbi:WhiB family transcriptional regulator [Nocardiopsis sp. NPDC101807]|uniref:WhiB family transcriptional regulator n=1 Tax=Nocardiopsis sp. NPDC101807 TaxID=3364339 RepID=UPI003815F9CC